jgi:Fe-S cluster biogenesis protein NfuA
VKEQILKEIESVRSALQADGGDVEFVDYADGVVRVRLKGACSGCPMATLTLKNYVERLIRSKVPEVKAVEAVE